MKKIIITITTMTVLLIFSNSCSTSYNESSSRGESFSLILNKEKERRFDIISKSIPLFAKINEKKNNIYAYFVKNQDKDCEVLKMNRELDILNRYIIRNGIGPGEVRNPRIYGGEDNSIIIYDAPRYKYIEYSHDFKFIDEYRLPNLGVFLYSGGRYLPGDRIIIDGFYQFIDFFKGFTRIYALELTARKNTEKRKLFEVESMKRRRDRTVIGGRPIHFGYFYNHIYVLNKREYIIVKMDSKGNVLLKKKWLFRQKASHRPIERSG